MSEASDRGLSHSQVVSLASAWLSDLGYAIGTEAKLPSGRIADVAGVNTRHEIAIIECKSRLRASDIEQAAKKYGSHCNWLYIACPFSWRLEIERGTKLLGGWTQHFGLGLIAAQCDVLHLQQRPAYRQQPRSRLAWIEAQSLQTRLRM